MILLFSALVANMDNVEGTLWRCGGRLKAADKVWALSCGGSHHAGLRVSVITTVGGNRENRPGVMQPLYCPWAIQPCESRSQQEWPLPLEGQGRTPLHGCWGETNDSVGYPLSSSNTPLHVIVTTHSGFTIEVSYSPPAHLSSHSRWSSLQLTLPSPPTPPPGGRYHCFSSPVQALSKPTPAVRSSAPTRPIHPPKGLGDACRLLPGVTERVILLVSLPSPRADLRHWVSAIWYPKP